MGGKGRGIAFVHSVAARQSLEGRFPELPIRIPKTIVLGTDLFDRFLGDNGLALDRLATMDDRAIAEAFLAGRLDDRLARDLEVAFKDLAGPVAVLSSLLEDEFQPFAGIYATVMLPNALPDARDRFRELCRAIAAVYASTYSRDARSYFAGTPHSVEEKMAVVIRGDGGESHEGASTLRSPASPSRTTTTRWAAAGLRGRESLCSPSGSATPSCQAGSRYASVRRARASFPSSRLPHALQSQLLRALTRDGRSARGARSSLSLQAGRRGA
ncbi:MAG: PEP/pyruvate-binding domain-containing protein [Acidobacteriota bacterium]